MSNRSPRWAVMQRLDIPDSINPELIYLRRLRILCTPWFGVMLHRIYLPDRDRDPHDHPWNFHSIVLRGAYHEVVYLYPNVSLDEQYQLKSTWGRFSRHRIGVEQAHRITGVASGTLTLVFTGRRRRTWGFFTPGGWVDWREYVNVRSQKEEEEQ